MGKSKFIAKFFDKEYEQKGIDELCEVHISTISGISESDALVLRVAFGVKTVRDLATNEYVKLTQGVSCFQDLSVLSRFSIEDSIQECMETCRRSQSLRSRARVSECCPSQKNLRN